MKETIKIVLTGPESVGKSTLTEQLSSHYNSPYVPELARSFIENLSQDYTKDNVLTIAKLQIKQEQVIIVAKPQMVFFDTDLIITKIWLQHVYGDSPNWIDEHIKSKPADLHLLCYPDLPWEADNVRENAEIRPYLYNLYKSEIEKFGFPYVEISGLGEDRLKLAISTVQEIIGD